MNKYFGLLFFAFLGYGCTSVAHYNAKVEHAVEIEKLKQDVDFAKKKLFTQHVNLDWYYPKEVIAFRLDSFKNAIQYPMQPNDFSKELSKVVSSFGHGHTYVSQLNLKLDKTQRKKYKGSVNPLNLLEFKTVEGRIYLDKNFSKDTTLTTNAELLALENYSFADFVKHNSNVRAGDGYTKVLNQNYVAQYFINYSNRKLGLRDSLILTLQKNDSVYTQVIRREFKKKKEKPIAKADPLIAKKDTVTPAPRKHLTKEEKLKAQALLKHKNEIKKFYAYDEKKQQYNRALKFPNPNDSTTVLLDINSFTLEHHKKAYDHIFDSIHRLGTKNLILDLRENGGGYPEDINHLFAHLTVKDEPQMVTNRYLKVNSKFAVAKRYVFPLNVIRHTILLPYALYKTVETSFRTQKVKGEYYYNDAKAKDFIFKDKNKFSGQLYVLTSGKTYSAASLIATALHAEGKAIFVGEETGGDYNGTVAGFSKDYTLPHSKIKIMIPQMVFQPNQTRELKGRGVLPHQEIKYTFQDLMNQKDPQMDWILNHIASNTNE